MKYLFCLPFVLAFTIFGTSAISENDQPNPDKEKLIVKTVLKTISNNHYSPKELNDQFSNEVFETFIKRLDYNKRFFLQSDIENFKTYYNEIDDQLERPSFEFFELVVATYLQRLEEGRGLYTYYLENPFELGVDENYQSDPEKRKFSATEDDRKDLWRKMLKFSVLSRVANKTNEIKEAIETNDTSVDVEKTPVELEEEAREKVKKNFDNWYKRLDKQKREDRFNTYVGSIVSVMDAHSSYYPPKKKEDFDIRISGKLEGIGATLQEKDGYITVTRIVPGSPSDMQGELKVDDKITKVAQGEEEAVDIVDMRLDEAVRLIRGKKGTEVRLTVKSKGGTTKVIPIIRDVVVLEETYAKSAVMEKDGERLGYIYLPRFYADFKDKKNGRHCSDDIAKEIKKLKKENIDGIIFDLRGNGGGSLSDVVKMSGLFIEDGPIVQVQDKDGMAKTYDDYNPEVLYDDPVIVMVDNFSASASEIMAAALQDYDRAVVIGSNRTYGKGTVQRFFDLDRMIYGKDELKPLGAIKLTTQKFYRINGGATQVKGVEPDVILPNNYSYLEDMGESELDYVLPWDEIRAARYSEVGNGVKESKLQKSSDKRTSNHEVFKLIDENAKRLKAQEDDTVIDMNLENYLAKLCQREEEAKKFDDLEKPIDGLSIASIQADALAMESDTSKIERTEKWHKDLIKDVYLEEAFSIFKEIH